MASKKKACEYCENDYFADYEPQRNGFTLWYEWYPNNDGLFAVMAQANNEEGEMMEDSIEFNFNYCPMCGRKLT